MNHQTTFGFTPAWWNVASAAAKRSTNKSARPAQAIYVGLLVTIIAVAAFS